MRSLFPVLKALVFGVHQSSESARTGQEMGFLFTHTSGVLDHDNQ